MLTIHGVKSYVGVAAHDECCSLLNETALKQTVKLGAAADTLMTLF